jgi:uncharacterized protein YfaS (alpha-2-macroglobulin family)
MAFTIKQSDTSPSLRATLQNANGTAINLTSATVRFHMKSLDGTVVLDKAMTVTTPLSGIVTYNWQTGDTATAGTYFAEFEVTYADLSIETFPNTGNLPIVITPELN